MSRECPFFQARMRHWRASRQWHSAKWGGQLLIVGHQPAPMGYEMQNRSQLIVTSDHEFGMTLVIDLGKKYSMDDLIVDLVPLASVDA